MSKRHNCTGKKESKARNAKPVSGVTCAGQGEYFGRSCRTSGWEVDTSFVDGKWGGGEGVVVGREDDWGWGTGGLEVNLMCGGVEIEGV